MKKGIAKMNTKKFPVVFAVALGALSLVPALAAGKPATKPNVVFILADDLGYGEVGCYGQTIMQTPQLDRMAAEGMRFTQFYCGNTVCAPSRAVLLTGLHNGHANVRGNVPPLSAAANLPADEPNVARVLKSAGYATGIIGKWGLGTPDSAGHPNRQGFDYFFGYLTHHHAHNHYPAFLWRNSDRVPLANIVQPMDAPPGDVGGYATHAVQYADDLFADEAITFIERHQDHPFFLFFSLDVPHANNERMRALHDGNEVPDYGPYADRDWSAPQKGHAAMITRLDGYVGRVLARLKALGLDEKTLVIFSSDNGHHNEGGEGPVDLFDKNGSLRGMKRDLYEGGIRVPCIARWPGKIKPGSVSRHVGYFGDFLSTAAELAGVPEPSGRDGLSFAPALLGAPQQKTHAFLYWEFYEGGFTQAVLLEGRWKAVRKKGWEAHVELFDLANDLGEVHDVADPHPDLVQRSVAIMQREHIPHPAYPTSKTGGDKHRRAEQPH